MARARARARPRAACTTSPPSRRAAESAGHDRRDGAPRRHRHGPGANDNASGTAALIELARAYAQPQTGRRSGHLATHASCSSRPTAAPSAASAPPISSSTRRIATASSPSSTSTRSPGTGKPEHRDRRRPAALAERDARRDHDRADRRADRRRAAPRRLPRAAHRPRVPVHALRAGPVRRAPASRRSTITTGGDRPPPAFGDRAAALDQTRLGQLGAAAQQLARLARPEPRLRAEHGQLRLGRRPHRPRLGDRARPRRAAGAAVAVAIVDLYALCRRQGVALAAGHEVAAHPASVLAFRRARFHVFSPARRLAERAGAAAEPGDRRPQATGPPGRSSGCSRSPGSAGRSRVPASRCGVRSAAEEEIAGYTVALVALLVVALGITATNAVRADLRPAGAARLAVAAADPDRAAARAARRSSRSAWRAGDPRPLDRPALRARARHALVPARARRDRLHQADSAC